MSVVCGMAAVVYAAGSTIAGGGGGARGGGAIGGGGTQLQRGEYLATIGACGACHTPARVPARPPGEGDTAQIALERQFRNDPDWRQYLDEDKELAGGVPFIIRFGKDLHGTVYSRNITPDVKTGIGSWSVEDITKALRTGIRPDGNVLLLFPPHSFYNNMAEQDATDLAVYLKNQASVENAVPEPDLPFPGQPATNVSTLKKAPQGATRERAEYLLKGLVGCTECHSYEDKGGVIHRFAGGDPISPNVGVFRLGPDLPLRATEKGLSAFPFPGYAALYGPNLSEFGHDGPARNVSITRLMRAIRHGIGPGTDGDGRPELLLTTMLWQYYQSMRDDDARAIAKYIKALDYEPHDNEPHLKYFGTDWRALFKQIWGEEPSQKDAEAFGKSQ